MEGFVWLLLKMAGLLTAAGASFFALGWWARNRTAAAMRSEIEQLKTSVHSACAERDEARQEAQAAHENLRISTQEIHRLIEEHGRLQSLAAMPQNPDAPAKPKAKPRTRRKKQEI